MAKAVSPAPTIKQHGKQKNAEILFVNKSRTKTVHVAIVYLVSNLRLINFPVKRFLIVLIDRERIKLVNASIVQIIPDHRVMDRYVLKISVRTVKLLSQMGNVLLALKEILQLMLENRVNYAHQEHHQIQTKHVVKLQQYLYKFALQHKSDHQTELAVPTVVLTQESRLIVLVMKVVEHQDVIHLHQTSFREMEHVGNVRMVLQQHQTRGNVSVMIDRNWVRLVNASTAQISAELSKVISYVIKINVLKTKSIQFWDNAAHVHLDSYLML